jgi:hypothetical protein
LAQAAVQAVAVVVVQGERLEPQELARPVQPAAYLRPV